MLKLVRGGLPDEPTLAFTAEELTRQADALSARRHAANTQRAYKADWTIFEEWCRKYPEADGSPRSTLPASVETIRIYLAAHATGPNLLLWTTLNRRLASIARRHREAGLEPPTNTDEIKRLKKGLRRAQAAEGIVSKGKTALLSAEFKSAVVRMPGGDSKIAIRNRAILLLGFGGAFRRSEIVGLNLADVEIVAKGLVVTLRISKTNQEGAEEKKAIPYGRETQSCPVLAYKAWIEQLAAAGIKRGPVFYGMDRHDNIGPKRLRGEAVALIVKAAVVAIGIDAENYGGHSLRAGFITSALIAGADREDVKKHSGHTSNAFEVYFRDQNLFDRHPGALAGL